MKVATTVMAAKVSWELEQRVRRVEEREEEGEVGGAGEWREEEEVKRQEEKDILDVTNGSINYTKRYITDIPTCRRLNPPKALPTDQAVILENMKHRIEEVTKNYLKNCDKKGLPNAKNISKEEEQGIKEMKDDGENVFLTTDKSGKLVAQKREYYIEGMEPHLGGDQVITWEQQCTMERYLTATTLLWGRFLRLGVKWGAGGRHTDRVRTALRTKFCLAPPVSGYYKDHKPLTPGSEHLGPKLRPVVGAVESANGPLSHILAEILSFLGDRMDTEVGALCLSTEEMCGALEAYNQRASTTTNPVIISMDVVGMYPNMEQEGVARTCREEFLRSDLVVEEVDTASLGLYLAITYQDRREELVQLGLDTVVQKRKHPRAKKILITTDEATEAEAKTESKFHPQEQQPTREQTKLMMALAIEQGILAVFQQHYYSWNNSVRLQGEGAPIGLEVSGAAGKVAMLAWVRSFKARMEVATSTLPNPELYLHELYVDDNNVVLEELPPGTRLEGGVFQVREELVEEDSLLPGDMRTAGLVRELANTLCPYLQMEADYPSNHPTGWMPILDLEVRMAEDKSVDFRWYSKPMASPYSILNRSAMPPSVKRITLVQRGISMLRNTRERLHAELRVPLMEKLATTMMVSGYPEDFRRGVIESAVVCYERQVAASRSGAKPLYRPRAWQAVERRRKKLISKMAWFRPADTVLRVPYTPDSELARRVRVVVEEEASRLELRVKVVEGGGVPLRHCVVTSDLGRGEPCPQGNCLLCLTGEGGGGLHHHRSGAVYRGECTICSERIEGSLLARYTGESGFSAYCRTLDHQKAVETKDKVNAFSKHLEIHHPDQVGNIWAFKFSLLELHQTPLPRLASESCFIHSDKVDIPMNSKAEFHQPAVGRVVITRELEELEEQEGRRGSQGGGRSRGGI